MMIIRDLKEPDFGVNEIINEYLSCVKKKTETYDYLKKNQRNLTDFEKIYLTAYHQYIKKKVNINTKSNLYKDIINKKELKKAYNNPHMKLILHKKIIAEEKPYCAVCGCELIINELDHVLPKHTFPEYYLTPKNLVPICSDCNFYKNYQEKKQNKIVYNSYIEKNKDFRNDIRSNYSIDIKNDRLIIKNENKLEPNEAQIVKSYGLDERIRLKSQLVFTRIVEQLRFILENDELNNKISKDQIKIILQNLNYDKDGIDGLVISALIRDADKFIKYLDHKFNKIIGAKNSNASKIEKEFNELVKDENINIDNEHVKKIRTYLHKR